MYPQEQKSSDWCSNMVGINLLSIFPIIIVLFVYAGFIYGITTALSFCQLSVTLFNLHQNKSVCNFAQYRAALFA
jgi:hypothetical protein